MKSVILDILYNRCPNYENIKLNEEYLRLSEEERKLSEKFAKGLSAEQKEMFDKIYELLIKEADEYEAEHFKAGFKMGFLLGFELHEDQD